MKKKFNLIEPIEEKGTNTAKMSEWSNEELIAKIEIFKSKDFLQKFEVSLLGEIINRLKT